MISVDKVIKSFKQELKEIYPSGEIMAIIEMVFEHFLGFSKIDMVMKSQANLSEDKAERLYLVLERLKKYEPVQYILGECFFYNLKLKVQPGVLIPRQETEELVDWIVKECLQYNHYKILDIGTGSGCIAVSLASVLKTSEVFAFDISEKALDIASDNAELNGTKIKFEKYDILANADECYPARFDVIVSNPPYVLEKEKDLMQKNVVDYEPAIALFVNNDDPLLFYRAILNFTGKNLKKKGKLYMEINENYASEVEALLYSSAFKEIKLKKDINGRNRMITGIKY